MNVCIFVVEECTEANDKKVVAINNSCAECICEVGDCLYLGALCLLFSTLLFFYVEQRMELSCEKSTVPGSNL